MIITLYKGYCNFFACNICTSQENNIALVVLQIMIYLYILIYKYILIYLYTLQKYRPKERNR